MDHDEEAKAHPRYVEAVAVRERLGLTTAIQTCSDGGLSCLAGAVSRPRQAKLMLFWDEEMSYWIFTAADPMEHATGEMDTVDRGLELLRAVRHG